MEEKIYNRQITKLSLSCRVVDEQQIDRHYSNHNLAELYKFEPNTGNKEATLNLPKDRLLAEIFLKYKSYVETYHEHDSLLENKADEELNEEERKQAWLEYEEEKKGKPAQPYVMMPPFNPNMMVNQFDLPSSSNITIDYGKLQELIRKDYPNVTPQCQKLMVDRAYSDMYHYWEQQAMLNASANRILTQNTAMTQIFTTPQISQTTQVSQIPQTIHKTQNLNKNKSGSMRELVANPFRIRNSTTTVTDIADDDIVEVPTSTRSSVSHILQNSLQSSKKNIQEEE